MCTTEGGRAALCLTEPEAGGDVSSIGTTATDMGDHYVTNGWKCFLGNGCIAEIHTVFTTTDKSEGIGGMTGFIVDRKAEGLSMGKKEDKMGLRLTKDAFNASLNICSLEDANKIEDRNQAFLIVSGMLEGSV